MNWDEILGHQNQQEMFKRSVARNRLSHAYLFVGPDGIGKKKFAQTIAASLFCETIPDSELNSCGECANCKRMKAGSHPDFYLVGRPPDKREIPIEVFAGSKDKRGREGLCFEMSLRPMASTRKIAIIDDASSMNMESANSLLKTLEEPPEFSMMILIANNENSILPTILSRCQKVRFQPLAASDISKIITRLDWVENSEQADQIAAMSDGSLTLAQQLLDPELRNLREVLFGLLINSPFNSVSTTKRIQELLNEIGTETVLLRENSRWVIRFTVEFFQSVSKSIISGNSKSMISQVNQFVTLKERKPEKALSVISDLIDMSGAIEQQILQYSPAALCMEGYFNNLGQKLRLF